MTVPVPSEFFVIQTRDATPIARWNIGLGSISSAGAALASASPGIYVNQQDRWLPWLPNPDFQTFASFHSMRVTSDMRAEYHAEIVRIREFPERPSRLACVYAWGSLDEAQHARNKMRGRFRGSILRCEPTHLLRTARCNSSLIGLAQRGESAGIFTGAEVIESFWRTYWSGSGADVTLQRQNLLDPSGPPETLRTSAEPVWEWLVDGTLTVAEIADNDPT